MPDSVQCVDLESDRALGEKWERNFCKIAAQFGRSFTAHQIGRRRSAQAFFHQNGRYHPMTLPDITLWTAPGEHHEVKHKDQTKGGYFGLEKYRLEALTWFRQETKQRVFYTIHDYGDQRGLDRNERKLCQENDALHWVSCDVDELGKTVDRTEIGQSWVGGVARQVPICYWRSSRFVSTFWIWDGIPQRDMFGCVA